MPSCVIKCCKNRNESFRKCDGFTYHRFPMQDKIINDKWIKIVRHSRGEIDWTPAKTSVICSIHFDERDFYTTRNKCRRRLLKYSIPKRQPNIEVPAAVLSNMCSSLRSVRRSRHPSPTTYVKHPTPASAASSHSSTDEADSDSDGLIEDPSDISDFLVFNQAAAARAADQPSTSAEELQYQTSRYSMVSGNDGNQSTLEEIIIKEEITDEEKNQCRLCLSVGRRMQELAEYAPLYRKLLFESNYQNTTIPSFMYHMMACWECHAELRKIKRFQDKVRRANAAFETSQNQKGENLSNLSTILIMGEQKHRDRTELPSSVEECAQGIKEEAVEIEVEETPLPDPLEVGQEKSQQELEISIKIQKEANTSVPTKKVAKRTIPEPKTTQNVQKRAKVDQSTAQSGPKRAKLDQSGPKPAKEEENEPKSTPESEVDAIFGKVKIEIDELQKILEERRNKESFKSMKFKCDSCVLGFTDHNRLLEHNKNFHDNKVGSCQCDICERRFDDENLLSAHYRNHFVKFVCKLCNFECYTKTGRAIHFKRHKGTLQGTSLESLLKQKRTFGQRASASGSSYETST